MNLSENGTNTLVSTLTTNNKVVEITNISQHGIWIFIKEEELFMSYDDFPWFKNQTLDAVLNVKEIADTHLYWSDIDVDLSLESIRFPEKYPLKAK